MANETVLFKRGDSDTITSTPVIDGQILFDTSGNGKMYLDNGTDRLEMGGAITVDASLSKTSTNAIQNKAVTGNILNSLAEVSAATQQNTIAGALALKEVNSSLKANNNQIYMDYHDGKYGINTSSSRGADTFIPFRSDCDMKAIVTFTSNANNPAGYTTIYKGEDELQSISFDYNASGVKIGLGFLKFAYNNGTAIITALCDCIVNDKEYSKNETVAKLTGFASFKNYTYTITFD